MFFSAMFLILKLNYGQESINYSYNHGKIVIHNPAIKELSAGKVHGITINYTLSENPGKSWRRFYNDPDIGLSFNMESFNSPRIIGNSYALRGFIQFSFLHKKKPFDVGFRALTGLNYFSKKYDPNKNPFNRAIGSHININGEGRLFAKIKTGNVFLEYSFGFNHFSNGLLKSPNLGINLMNSNFLVGGNWPGPKKTDFSSPDEPVPWIKNEIWSLFSMGLKGIENNQKKYSFFGLSVHYSKQISTINKIGIGIDFSTNSSLNTLAAINYHYSGYENLNFRTGIHIHNEFLMGNFGVFGAYGLYLGNIDFYSSRRYYKTGFKYYFNNVVAAILIRAIPLFRAEVIEFGIGYRLADVKIFCSGRLKKRQ